MPTLEQIQNSVSAFADGNLTENAIDLFRTLGYESERRIPFASLSVADLETFITDDTKFNRKNALVNEWAYIDFLFQLTESELGDQNALFDGSGVDQRITSYLFFVVELKEPSYSRTMLSQITREVNKVFPIPAMVLFKYGEFLTLAVIDRQPHKLDKSRDVLRKVTLIKDIRFGSPHAAHRQILRDLALETITSRGAVQSFEDLHKAWQKVLDTKELNKKFFLELANWYFWAVETVEFPDGAEEERDVRNATSVIRLITRLIFVWFLKEKGLVSDKLFDRKYLKSVLKFNDESSYYKAILQNLFFATLNSDMGKRKFIGESSGGRNSQHFFHNVFRYENEFKTPKDTLTELFEPIPFLNGGLFECLDRQTDDGVVRIDGFSQQKSNKLKVPDDVFFTHEKHVDLSEVYDDPRKSNVKVSGLINILNSYKFTIAENTPVEEEIALDPELLGRVFENLLANYNPETKTTARKQTGSFYTPREIVNYMVEESLIAYLKRKLQTESAGFAGYIAIDEDQTTMFGNEARIQQKFEAPVIANRWKGKDDELEAELRILFRHGEEQHPFNEIETEILIKAIDDCKILDPACGSGAFPMGILHRLVDLLAKLDPDNKKWREWQERKAKEEAGRAFKITDQTERDIRLGEISDVFENNTSDYGRKLFLIENCIYGVDIQPIAIQIAKLRFFISLIVDQDFNDDPKHNRGVRPLPNLETKFVAANTLIGLETAGLKPAGVTDLEKKLKDVRAKHFSARTRRTKESYREKDKAIRSKIAELLLKTGFPTTSANQIADWDPYDQNSHAVWFDPEWMFGVSRFNVVIGNPPYGGEIPPQELTLLRRTYSLKTSETAILFIERGFSLIEDRGVLVYVIPKSYSYSSKYVDTRKFTLKDLYLTVDCGRAFENVLFEAMVFVLIKGSSLRSYRSVRFDGQDFHDTSTVNKEYVKQFGLVLNGALDNEIKLASKMANRRTKLKDIASNRRGEILNRFSASGQYSVIGGKEIDRYGVRKIRGKTNRNLAGSSAEIRENSVLVQGIVAHVLYPQDHIKIIACIGDGIDAFIADNINQIVINSNSSNKLVWALLNSTAINWFAYRFIYGKSIRTMRFDNPVTDRIPIPEASDVQRADIAEIVDKIIEVKKGDANGDIRKLERKIDALVNELFGLTDDEIDLIEGRA